MLLRYTLSLLLVTSFSLAPLFAQINLNSAGNIGFGTLAPSGSRSYTYKFHMLNATNDRGFLFQTTKNSGGWMRGFVNEIRATNHSSVTLAMINDIIKHSGDRKSLYGLVNYMKHQGSGTNIGIQNILYKDGSGEKRGLYNNVQDNDATTASSTNHIFGVYNYIHSMYRTRAYGSYNLLVNSNADSNDKIYGVYVEETGSGEAATYGIYAKVDSRPGNYAAYFEGPTHINGTYNQASDKRFKKDIKEVANALAIVNSLRPTSYHFNDLAGKSFDKENLHYGFLAQDLEKVLPDLVSEVTRPASFKYDDEYLVNGDTTAVPKNAEMVAPATTYKAVRYNDLIAILAQALQEEDIKVKDHENKIKEEKNKNAKLSREIEALRVIVDEMSIRLASLEKCTQCGKDVKSATVKSQSINSSYLGGEEEGLVVDSTDLLIPAKTSQTSIQSVVKQQNAGFSIYPNPTVDQLTVEGPNGRNLRVYLFDGQGRRVLDLPFTNGRSELQIGNLPSGSYYLEIFDEGASQSVGQETVILR